MGTIVTFRTECDAACGKYYVEHETNRSPVAHDRTLVEGEYFDGLHVRFEISKNHQELYVRVEGVVCSFACGRTFLAKILEHWAEHMSEGAKRLARDAPPPRPRPGPGIPREP